MAAITDDFAGDGDLNGRTTTTGGGTWAVTAGGTFATASGQAKATTGGATRSAFVDFGAADMDAKVTLATFVSSSSYICARVVDGSNYWFAWNNGTTWKLTLNLSNSLFDDANTYTAAGANNDIPEISVTGTATGAFTVLINGTLRITSSQFETFNATGTKAGIATFFETTSRFDDFSVQTPGSPPPPPSSDTPELYGRPAGHLGQTQLNQLLAT